MLPTKKTWGKLKPLFPLLPLPPTMSLLRVFFPGRHGLSKRIRMIGFLERPWGCILSEITHENVISNEFIKV